MDEQKIKQLKEKLLGSGVLIREHGRMLILEDDLQKASVEISDIEGATFPPKIECSLTCKCGSLMKHYIENGKKGTVLCDNCGKKYEVSGSIEVDNEVSGSIKVDVRRIDLKKIVEG